MKLLEKGDAAAKNFSLFLVFAGSNLWFNIGKVCIPS
jgi:hypothetical protein